MVGKLQISPLRVFFSPWGKECTVQFWKCWTCEDVDVSVFSACLLLVMRRPPVLPPALVDTEALSQGCSSALLFRDNDKDLNPSVDSTFVPSSIFKLYERLRVAIWPVQSVCGGGIRCMFGQWWLQEPPSVWFGNPTSTTQPPAKPSLIYQIPQIIMWCLLWREQKVRRREQKKKSLLLLDEDFEVWSLTHVTDVSRRVDRDVYARLLLSNWPVCSMQTGMKMFSQHDVCCWYLV